MFEQITWLVAKIVSIILAWFDIADLRGRVADLERRNSILRVALEDIVRIDKDGLCGKIAKARLKEF